MKPQTCNTLKPSSLAAFTPVRPTTTRRQTCLVVKAAAVKIPSQYSKVMPKGDLVLCKSAEAEEKTTAGILLPSSAQKKPTSGDVVAVGDGRVGSKTMTFTLKAGDTILYSRFGFGVTDLSMQDEDYILIREDDCIGVMPGSGATADDIPKLKPLGDRVLLKVQESADVTLGGVMLPSSAKERPMAGEVVAVGPGKVEEDGERKEVKVKPGEKVLYFKYAGEPMETPSGEKYTVVHGSDLLCKL